MKLTHKTYVTKGEKYRDFWIGFGGWFVLNGAFYAANEFWGFTYGMFVVAGLTNLLLLLYLFFSRQWMALGDLVALALVLLPVTLAALCLNAM